MIECALGFELNIFVDGQDEIAARFRLLRG